MAKRDRPTEKQVQEAYRVIYRDYYQDVLDTAEELVGQVRDGELGSADDANDRLHELLDSDRRVFVTWQARLGLLASDNADAAFEEGLVDASNWSEGIDYSALMYFAMEADVRQRIAAGVEHDDWPDPFDDETYEEDEPDEITDAQYVVSTGEDADEWSRHETLDAARAEAELVAEARREATQIWDASDYDRIDTGGPGPLFECDAPQDTE